MDHWRCDQWSYCTVSRICCNASGGNGYITIQEADKSNSTGTFYRTLDGASDGSSYHHCRWWIQLVILPAGWRGRSDDRDANRLMPLMASSRLVSLTHNGERTH